MSSSLAEADTGRARPPPASIRQHTEADTEADTDADTGRERAHVLVRHFFQKAHTEKCVPSTFGKKLPSVETPSTSFLLMARRRRASASNLHKSSFVAI